MPTYEYVCKCCGDGFEVTQAFNDAALTTCGTCGGTLKRVYGSIGIVFKGGGFYRTENRSNHSAMAPANNGKTSDPTVTDAPAPSPPPKKEDTTGTSTVSASTGTTKPETAKPAAKA
jgi:putative FmdB family regulatory protein